jgi:hypothetical protein
VAENEIHDESEWTVAELLEEYQDALDRENRLRQRLEAAGTFMGSLIKQMEIATDETYMPMTDAARDESRFAREALSMEARLWMEENGLVAVLDALNHGTGNCTVILTDPKDRKIPIIGVVRRFSSSGSRRRRTWWTTLHRCSWRACLAGSPSRSSAPSRTPAGSPRSQRKTDDGIGEEA